MCFNNYFAKDKLSSAVFSHSRIIDPACNIERTVNLRNFGICLSLKPCIVKVDGKYISCDGNSANHGAIFICDCTFRRGVAEQ